MLNSFSVRESLQGAIGDYVRQSGFLCVRTEEIIRDLTCLLMNYREEDVKLFPTIFILSQIETLATISPGARRIQLGNLEYSESTAKIVLKNCASLATGGWSIYLAKLQNGCFAYGVFLSLKHSYATSASESAKDLGDACPVIILQNSGNQTVELTNSFGNGHNINFTSARFGGSLLKNHIRKISQSLTRQIAAPLSVNFSSYLNNVLSEIIQHCHGTLIGVCDPKNPQIFRSLSDGVWFEESLDWRAAYQLASITKDAEALSDLQSIETLVAGMVNCDGLTILGDSGTIHACRVFLKPTDEEKLSLPDAGGGRRRTFQLMKSREGSIFNAGFFKSQDGATDYFGGQQ